MKYFKFIGLSLIGLLLFFVPLPINGEFTIFFGFLVDVAQDNIYDFLLLFGAVLSILTIILTSLKLVFKNKTIFYFDWFDDIIKVSIPGAIVRILGSIFYLIVYFDLGFSFNIVGDLSFPIINHEYTGQVIVYDFIVILFVTFLAGNLLLPLLIEFGLLEFVGSLLSRFTRKLFRIPGRATVDGLASAVGDGTIGIVITDKQYTDGYYTRREAVTIASAFSIVGIAFTITVAEILGFGNKFALFYGTILFSVFVAAIILPRTPFIKKFEDEYYQGKKNPNLSTDEKVSLSQAFKTGLDVAEKTKFKDAYPSYLKSIVSIYFTFIPIILFVGTIALSIAELTPVFDWLSAPLVPIMELLNIPDAGAAAIGSIVGIADMYLPALLVSEVNELGEFIVSDMTRFIVGTLSITQLIFLSETGTILLKTKMELSIFDVIKIFIIRTLITFPIILIIANIFF